MGFGLFYGVFPQNQDKLFAALPGGASIASSRDPYRGTGHEFDGYLFDRGAIQLNAGYRWKTAVTTPFIGGLEGVAAPSTPHVASIKQVRNWPEIEEQIGWNPTDPTHWQAHSLGDVLVHGLIVSLDAILLDSRMVPHQGIEIEILSNGSLLGRQTVRPMMPRDRRPELFQPASIQGPRVNLGTGELRHDIVLFRGNGPGLCVDMSLRYHSYGSGYWRGTAAWADQDEYVYAPFGQGWTGLYTLRILKEVWYRRDSNQQPVREEALSFQDADGVRYLVTPGAPLRRSGSSGDGEICATFGVPAKYVKFDSVPGGGHTLSSDLSPLVAKFDADGRLTELRRRDHGRPLTIRHQGDEVLIEDSQGRITQWCLTQGLVTQITDPANRVWGLNYVGKNLKSITRVDRGTARVVHIQFQFDYEPESSQLSEFIGRDGLKTEILYRTPGSDSGPAGTSLLARTVDRISEGSGWRRFVFERQSGPQKTTVTDSLTRTVTHEIDTIFWRTTMGATSRLRSQDTRFNKLEVEYTSPIGAPTSTQYTHQYPTAGGGAQSILRRSEDGHTVELDLDSSGFWVTGKNDSASGTTVYTPTTAANAVGLTELIQEPQIGAAPPLTTTFTYNDDGEVTRVVYSSGYEETLIPSSDAGKVGLVKQRIRQDGSGTFTEHYEYDALGHLTDWTDGLGRHSGYTYNDDDQLDTITHPDQTTTSHVYYPDGRLERIDYTGSPSDVYTYDGLGLVETIIEGPTGAQTIFGRNDLGELTSVQAPPEAIGGSIYGAVARLDSPEALMPAWLPDEDTLSYAEGHAAPPGPSFHMPAVRLLGIPAVDDF